MVLSFVSSLIVDEGIGYSIICSKRIQYSFVIMGLNSIQIFIRLVINTGLNIIHSLLLGWLIDWLIDVVMGLCGMIGIDCLVWWVDVWAVLIVFWIWFGWFVSLSWVDGCVDWVGMFSLCVGVCFDSVVWLGCVLVCFVDVLGVCRWWNFSLIGSVCMCSMRCDDRCVMVD